MSNKNITNLGLMKIVDAIADFSTCRVKVGAIIIDSKNKILSTGYVGSVSGDLHCNEVGCLLVDNNGKYGSGESQSCCRTCHAEANAVVNINIPVNVKYPLKCYSTYTPCLSCLKLLLSIGVREFYWKEPYRDDNRDTYMLNLKFKDTIIWKNVYEF